MPKCYSLRSGEDTSSRRVGLGWAEWIAWVVAYVRRSGEVMMWENSVVDNDSPAALVCCLPVRVVDHEP